MNKAQLWERKTDQIVLAELLPESIRNGSGSGRAHVCGASVCQFRNTIIGIGMRNRTT
jgi:hypothetical protein